MISQASPPQKTKSPAQFASLDAIRRVKDFRTNEADDWIVQVANQGLQSQTGYGIVSKEQIRSFREVRSTIVAFS